MSRPTVYNGSEVCQGCGKVITPLEAMWAPLCPACESARVRDFIKNGMADTPRRAST